MSAVNIVRLELGPFSANAYVLKCLKTGASVLVDAPDEPDNILKALQGTDPQYILLTHGHLDHVGALSELKSSLEVPVAAHMDDAGRIPVPIDVMLKDGDYVSFGDIGLQVIHTPGHTPGGLCFLTSDILISGDTLFPNGPGRTQSPHDFQMSMHSLAQKIFVLPGNTRVFPGHGEATVLEAEKKAFETFSATPHDPRLCGDVLWTAS